MDDMAFYDWNGDGKKDFTDDYIEYNIYKRSVENRNNGRRPGSDPTFRIGIIFRLNGLKEWQGRMNHEKS